MKKTIDIAYTIGKARWKSTAVSIISMLKNRRGYSYRIHIIAKPDLMADKDAQATMKKIVAKIDKKSSVKFITFDYKNASIKYSDDMPFGGGVCYFKLDLFRLLPNIDRVIFLDDDTIIMRPLDELATMDLGDNYLIVFKPGQAFKIMADGDKYGELVQLNAGVLVFNLKAIRESKVYKSFPKLIKDECLSFEQGLLAVAFKGHVKMFDGDTHYNYRTHADFAPGKKIGIIHYTGKKPWFFPTRKMFTWWKYAAKSPFHAEFLKNFLHNFLLYITVMLIPSKKFRHRLRGKYSKV
ncbi:MAG: hypothetical protein FWD15_04985 [Alphaproteobacteria bacterium]|nr:hypothetical protein [Alphaproteobacteria bacterium]